MLERVMIVSGESSGELYGAFLAKALKEKNPEVNIIGVGGDRMQTAGVDLISKISSSFGITEAIKTYREVKRTFKRVVSALKSFKPQVIVLIDYPDFNMKVAKEAKKLGIKVLYYVSPQIWAWRKGRVNTLSRLVDKMAVILPFEEKIYMNANIPCEFVGHPVMDEIREVISEIGNQKSEVGNLNVEQQKIRAKIKKDFGLQPDKPVMALMPGSRTHEIKRLLPVMSEVIKEMNELYPDYQFVVPVAPNLAQDALSEMNKLEKNVHFTNNAIKTLIASDVAVIASGTSTLQAALVGVPMVVVYKLSSLTYFIGRLIVKVKHISLPNILFDYMNSHFRIKELIQADVKKELIIKELSMIINNKDYREDMVLQIQRLRDIFINRHASSRVATIVEEIAS